MVGSLVVFSLLLSCPNAPSISTSLLKSLYPTITAAVQDSIALDACLHVLLHALFSSTPNTIASINWELNPPFYVLLLTIAASCPYADTRLTALSAVGEYVNRVSPSERMMLLQLLLEQDSPFPAMKVAAVGLLKINILEALEACADPSPFASPALLWLFGPIILRPDPPDLFERIDRVALDAFVDTEEPKRLVECLSLYDALIRRDSTNRVSNVLIRH